MKCQATLALQMHKPWHSDVHSPGAQFKEQSLLNLTKPSLIVMNDAKCHCARPPDVPCLVKMQKVDELVHCAGEPEKTVNGGDTVSVLKKTQRLNHGAQ